ncbi:UbiA family prenyltransferase [Indioceanicola profundi]|uniref:UbiA family prenyltransferase n=1 Tax=Indioceanicola profundi TaxID=2220096 RepID=UPI000E6AC450|nr:UbiA family prenyltransferase [Indioceanicola profundi]
MLHSNTAIAANDFDEARGVVESRPLIVDLDGTLLRTDLLYESFTLLIKQQPWLLLLIPYWLFVGGKAHLKREIARRVDLDVGSLPLNRDFLDWVLRQRLDGRTVAIVSASDQSLVDKVAADIGFFHDAIGSDGVTNLSGRRKIDAITAKFGPDFTYCGDAVTDIHVWEHCRSAVLVGNGTKLAKRLPEDVVVHEQFALEPANWRIWAKALRVHQWAKNGLVFVPLLLSGQVLDLGAVAMAALGTLILSLVASATYLLNDLLDLADDRQHRSKCKRPFACGALPLANGLLAIPVLAAAVGVLLLFTPAAFAAVTLLYLVVTLAYSFRLKRVPNLDLFVLAFLFTTRILAGITVIGAVMSPWLLTFSMFFFLSLAAMKRYTECSELERSGKRSTPGRGYRSGDHPWLLAMGAASGFCSALVFFMYLVEPDSPAHSYATPEILWFICMILGYWLSSAWLTALRGQMNDDPVLFALRDRQSRMLGVLTVLLVVAAHINWLPGA